jgi:hypothetical protein
MNYINDNTVSYTAGDTCAQAPLPEATLSDIVRSNTVDINNIKYVLENMYQHLYGNPEEKTGQVNKEPECFRDEIVAQSHNLTAINEKLARICSKLGM